MSLLSLFLESLFTLEEWRKKFSKSPQSHTVCVFDVEIIMLWVKYFLKAIF